MVDPKLISMLRCPIDGAKLELADKTLVDRVNEAIERGEIRDSQDQKIGETIQQGLVAAGGCRLYPIRAGIPTLIPDEAIEIGFLDN